MYDYTITLGKRGGKDKLSIFGKNAAIRAENGVL